MAKALIGYVGTQDPRITSRLVTENRQLRQQVADLRALVLRLQEENDALTAAIDPALLDVAGSTSEDMQPA
jgi:hypothetical protein